MKPNSLIGAAVATAILSGLSLVAALPVQAVTTGPTVIAVHRDGAVDVAGNGTFATVAKMTVPAGNWSISATATLVGTDTTGYVPCQLAAGVEVYTTRTLPSAQGAGSSQAIELLLVHHFTKTGTVTLRCLSDGWTGDVLVRDVHVVAVKVGQLVDNGTGTGTGAPRAYYHQDSSFRQYLDTQQYGIDNVSLPAGTWLVRAVLYGQAGSVNQPRVDCSLVSAGGATADQSFANFGTADRSISVEGVLALSTPDFVRISCHVSTGGWFVYGSAVSAIEVGTLKYGQLGGSLSTTGSGSPTVVGGYGGPGGITDATSPASIGSVPLSVGSWFVTSKLSVATGSATAKVTCQLKLSSGSSQDRVILDNSGNEYNWMPMSLTRKVTAASSVSVPCNQSAGSLGAFYYYLKIFALKAGTLTDTALN
jgi:hypothetical protein